MTKNTDRELWRKVPDDHYSPSLHVTDGNGIGMNVGGTVIVRPVEDWHKVMLAHIQANESFIWCCGVCGSPGCNCECE